MFSAIQENDLRFHMVREKDGNPHRLPDKVAKKDGKPVDDDDIVKAYETDKGTLVYLTDDDFEAAQDEGLPLDRRPRLPSRTASKYDPIYFEHTYYLGPDRRRREGLRPAGTGARALGAGGDRIVRDAPARAARLHPGARGHAHAREAVLRRRGARPGKITPSKRVKVETASCRWRPS